MPSSLLVSEIEFDSIASLSNETSAASNRIISQPNEWASLIEAFPPIYPTGELKADALWRMLLGDYVKMRTKRVSPDCVPQGTRIIHADLSCIPRSSLLTKLVSQSLNRCTSSAGL